MPASRSGSSRRCTAGIGGLAYAGIPVTHRDTNQAVTFITGSGADGRAPDLDWQAIAKGSPTIVLYMARKHAGEIAAKLIAAGRDGNEPAAIISNASLDGQATIVTRLAALGDAARWRTRPPSWSSEKMSGLPPAWIGWALCRGGCSTPTLSGASA